MVVVFLPVPANCQWDDNERRILYVAFTRAKRFLHVSFYDYNHGYTLEDICLSLTTQSLQDQHCILPAVDDDDDDAETNVWNQDPQNEQNRNIPAISAVDNTMAIDSDLNQNVESVHHSSLDSILSATLSNSNLFPSIDDLSLTSSHNSDAPTHRLNATIIAQHFVLNCPKKLAADTLLNKKGSLGPARDSRRETDRQMSLKDIGTQWEKPMCGVSYEY